jgi:hypothetical protein
MRSRPGVSYWGAMGVCGKPVDSSVPKRVRTAGSIGWLSLFEPLDRLSSARFVQDVQNWFEPSRDSTSRADDTCPGECQIRSACQVA